LTAHTRSILSSETFPDGKVASAYSRLVPQSNEDRVFSFVLLAPPVPLEQLEGMLNEQAHRETGVGEARCTKFHTDLRVGGKWSSSGVGPDGRDFAVTGEYLEVDRPRLVVQTWVASWTGEGEVKTTVRWELTPTKQGTWSVVAG
jgi:hypothetical protein